MAWIDSRQTGNGRSSSFGSGGSVARGGVRTFTETAAQTFLGQVYRYMTAGLAVTGGVALLVGRSDALLRMLVLNRPVFIGLIVAQLLMVMAFSPVAARVRSSTAALMFFGYAALSGVTFASIFLMYTGASIAGTFFVTAGMFGGLSAYGAVTKRSLDGVGSFAMMGLWGLILASIVNMFLGSPMLYWLTTFVGVLVFTGLAAYDTAKLKELGASADVQGEQGRKLALQGALILYLDFINLFLMLLRLFGGRRRD